MLPLHSPGPQRRRNLACADDMVSTLVAQYSSNSEERVREPQSINFVFRSETMDLTHLTVNVSSSNSSQPIAVRVLVRLLPRISHLRDKKSAPIQWSSATMATPKSLSIVCDKQENDVIKVVRFPF